MHQYKFFFLDERGHVFRAQDHFSQDDLNALAAAKNLCGRHIIEVWQGARQIARVKMGDEALKARDQQSP